MEREDLVIEVIVFYLFVFVALTWSVVVTILSVTNIVQQFCVWTFSIVWLDLKQVRLLAF